MRKADDSAGGPSEEELRHSDPAHYGEDEAFSEEFRSLMRRVFAPLNWLRRR